LKINSRQCTKRFTLCARPGGPTKKAATRCRCFFYWPI